MESQLIKLIEGKLSNMGDGEILERLNEISKQIEPKHSSVLLNLQDNSSIESVRRNYLKMLEGLKIWIESGHNEEIAKELGFKVLVL